ncbi:MAG: hypothetical protein HYZ14_17870 [Bacteroidetes bacterium]|nr:hypothetical protein [Bacteroidota bacterium]
MRRFVFFSFMDYDFQSKETPEEVIVFQRERLLKEHLKVDDVQFTSFDLKNGKIVTEIFEKNGKLLSKNEEKKYKKYNKSEDFEKPEKIFNNVKLINKTHVYNFIIELGKQNPGELYGLMIYGNYKRKYTKSPNEFAYLVRMYNVYWEPKDPAYDNRELLELYPDDLSIVKMGVDNQNFFKKAFNKEAKNQVLLSDDDFSNAVFSDYIGLLMNDGHRFKGAYRDDTVFNLKKLNVHRGDLPRYLKQNFPEYESTAVTVEMLKRAFCTALKSQYEYALMKISGVTSYGNPLGVSWTDPFYSLWNMPHNYFKARLAEERGIFEQALKFYKVYFGIEDTDEDLLAIAYSPDFICDFVQLNKQELELPKIQKAEAVHYIFLAGIDYKNKQKPLEFSNCFNNRMDEVIQAGPDENNFVFHCFDFLKGKKRTIECLRRPDGIFESKESEPDELDTFSAIQPSRDYKAFENELGESENYFVNDKYYLKKSERYLLTIQQFYTLILVRINASIPVKYPGLIKEIAFFSHGDETGPVIYNSRSEEQKENEKDTPSETIPVDRLLDPHPSDWSLPRFDPGDAADKNTGILRRVLTPDVEIVIYGCNSNRNYAKLIKAIVESDAYKLGNLSEDSLITLKNPGRELKQFLKKHTSLTKDEQSTPLKLKYRMGELLRFFRDLLKSSYMLAMAIATQKPVYGGLPGMNTYIIETDKDSAHINVESEFRKLFKFYERHFGFENDHDLVKKRSETSGFNGYWFDPDTTGGYAKYVPNFPWFEHEKDGLEGVNF